MSLILRPCLRAPQRNVHLCWSVWSSHTGVFGFPFWWKGTVAELTGRVAGALSVTRPPFLSEIKVVCSHNLLCGSFTSYPLQGENLVKRQTVWAEVYLTKLSKYFKGRSLKSYQAPPGRSGLVGSALWVFKMLLGAGVSSWPVFLNLPRRCGAPL